ncbi:MAG: 2-alkenal reductase [Acidobacteria bacterium]|nr:2-alkenal reductase [Acidobacteriota bacterium]
MMAGDTNHGRRRWIRPILVTALLSSAATVLLIRWDLGFRGDGIAPGRRPQSAIASAPVSQPPLSPEEEVNIRVYNGVSPGVVNITTTVVEYPFFWAPVAEEGTGSGVILDKEGNIVTNYHVIEDAQSLEVTLPDQSNYRARLVGIDRANDLAVIRLVEAPASRLHPVPIGDSTLLKVGQKVLAIGNPFRLQNTLTVGVVSSVGRRIRTEDGGLIEDVIQTDAAINPGNSGGPLLNTAGEMIGINTSIIGKGNLGIGFAVPSSTVRRVVSDLIREGRVIRPSLGIDGYSITDELASALGLPVNQGILIAKVLTGGSADKAGLRGADQMLILYNERILIGGDIITQIDGKAVNSMDELRLVLEKYRPGQTVQVTFYRGRTKMQKAVLLLEQPSSRGWRF